MQSSNQNDHILLNYGDIKHDAVDSTPRIKYANYVLPEIYNKIIDGPKDNSYWNIQEKINKSCEILKDKLTNKNLGYINRYQFTEVTKCSIKSDIDAIKISNKALLPSSIIYTFQDNVSPTEYIQNPQFEIINTPATFIDPASRKKPDFFEPKQQTVIDLSTQGLKGTFTSNYNLKDETVRVTIKLGEDILDCSVNYEGVIKKFYDGTNIPNDDYFSGNPTKNDFINSICTGPCPLTGNNLKISIFYFLCKELGDTLQSVYIKKLIESPHKINKANCCLFTSDTWCAARAILNTVPVLLRNADCTISVYSPLSKSECNKLFIKNKVEEVKKNNTEVYEILYNIINSYKVTPAGTTVRTRGKFIYIYLGVFRQESIPYTENIKNFLIKINEKIKESIDFLKKINSNNNKNRYINNYDKIISSLNFLYATSPFIKNNQYYQNEEYLINPSLNSIFNIAVPQTDIISQSLSDYTEFLQSLPDYTKFPDGFLYSLKNIPSQGGDKRKRLDDSNDSDDKKKRLELELNKSFDEDDENNDDENNDDENDDDENNDDENDDDENNDDDSDIYKNTFISPNLRNSEGTIWSPKNISENNEENEMLIIYTFSIYERFYLYLLEFPSLYEYFKINIKDLIPVILKYKFDNYVDFKNLNENENKEYYDMITDYFKELNDVSESDFFQNYFKKKLDEGLSQYEAEQKVIKYQNIINNDLKEEDKVSTFLQLIYDTLKDSLNKTVERNVPESMIVDLERDRRVDSQLGSGRRLDTVAKKNHKKTKKHKKSKKTKNHKNIKKTKKHKNIKKTKKYKNIKKTKKPKKHRKHKKTKKNKKHRKHKKTKKNKT